MYINLHLYNDPTKVTTVTLRDLSKTMKVADLQKRIEEECGISISLQKLIHKGKILSGAQEETLFHYNINYNETIQVHKRAILGEISTNKDSKESTPISPEKKTEVEPTLEDCESELYAVGDLVDVKDLDESSETIGAYFEAKIKRITKNPTPESTSDGLNYHIVYDNWPNDDTDYKLTNMNIRPRARKPLKLEDLKPEDKILVNLNQQDNDKVGEWYAAQVIEVVSRRKLLTCTVFVGVDNTPLPDVKISQLEQIFALEEPIAVAERDSLTTQALTTSSIKRVHTVECEECGDNGAKKCKECGCNKCGKKNNPESLIICDECQKNFHLKCIGLRELPEDDYYCAECKREDTTIKPGDKLVNKKLKSAPSQVKEQKRDWGKGFACAGRSTTNDTIPGNFKGAIPGTQVGMTWSKRIQLSENGIHRPPVAGIHANEKDGAMSIVLNGGYEDDLDNGEEFLYTGSGGRDLGGNRRTNVQSFDQELTKSNKGLAANCNTELNEEGGEAKDWKKGVPVRVVRGFKLKKHAPAYAPPEGFRYDGIYKVVKYYKQKGQSGFYVWRYVLRRDDPNPTPWSKEGKKLAADMGWSVIYPEGYIPPPPKEKGGKKRKNNEMENSENVEPSKNSKQNKGAANNATPKTPTTYKVPPAIKALITKDKNNGKVWKELMDKKFTNQMEFQDAVEEAFACSICLLVVTLPQQLPNCSHSMCQTCLTRLNAQNEKEVSKICPTCRADIKGEAKENTKLREILNAIFPGYEAKG